MDDGGIRAGKLRESCSWAGWDIPKGDIGDNLEELEAHLSVIRLKVTLGIDNESGCNCREQTGLYPQKNPD